MSDLQTAAGTVLGAGLGAGVTFALGIRKERSERTRSANAAREQALKAARVLQEDLAWGEARVVAALESGKYWSRRYALRDDSWVEYRDPIAVALPDLEDWSAVQGGFSALRTLELQAGRRRSDNEFSRPSLTLDGREQAEQGLAAIREAMAALRPVAGDPPVTNPEPDHAPASGLS